QVPTYFFLLGSQTDVPWPWNGWPGPISPLKSVIRQSPPQPMTLVSTPLEVMGGAPGAMNISTVASQAPSSCLRMACSGPGLGMGGMPSWAARGPARITAATAAASAVLIRFIAPPSSERSRAGLWPAPPPRASPGPLICPSRWTILPESPEGQPGKEGLRNVRCSKEASTGQPDGSSWDGPG